MINKRGFIFCNAVYLVAFIIQLSESQEQVCLSLPNSNQQNSQNDVVSTTAGPPGKRGPIGPVGPRGPIGDKGDVGECSCDPTEIEDLKTQLSEIKSLLIQNQKSGHCPLGMEYGFIKDSQITASSEWSGGGCGPTRARLNSRNSDSNNDLTFATGDRMGGWHPASSQSTGSWLQVDLLEITKITGVITQGRGPGDQANQWMKSYHVHFRNDGSNWQVVTNESGEAVEFSGNFDRYSIVTNFFPSPICARYIRLMMITWENVPVVRFELLGC